MPKELDKAYEPKKYEDAIYQAWEDSGLFNPDICIEKGVTSADADPFTIVLPPPNVTGTLHMGHAAMLAIEDCLVRYHRMKGHRTLWIPGTDHAAVATESKVEGILIQEGMQKPKEELGREAFLERVKKFAQESHDTIINQSKKMGSSLDWSREAYTLDDARNLAVRTVFKKMYDDGLIYRGYRVINWSVKGQSTCSDDELVYVERPAKLYTFKYSKDFPISIATTRPETKLGDTAVAVHPDGKYKEFIGREFVVENMGQSGHTLKIKIIADNGVDENFGTGALGVTPAHSMVDFDMYQEQKRQGTPIDLIAVIGEDGRMTKNAGDKYVGCTVEEAREKFVQYLRDNDLLEKEEDIMQNVGTSDRFKDPVEPLPKTQWFIDVNKKVETRDAKIPALNGNLSLKERMQIVVREKNIEILPERFDKTYFHWIDNLRDWCISRQIWFGHQIPVWYKRANKGVKITFVRHGETEAVVEGWAPGHLETQLTDEGRNKTRLLKESLPTTFDAIFSSDLQRAVETSQILFGDTSKIITDKRLREIDYGDLSGKSNTEVNPLRTIGYPNGETYQQVRDRVALFLSELIDTYDGKHVVIVAHSGVRKVLDVILQGMDLNHEHLTSSTPFDPVEYNLSEIQYVGVDAPQGEGWNQDGDTLDTWFSSGLWTFSTLGWPEETKDLKDFHPTSVLETGYDILFFWVARMILMTTYTLGDVPFKTVYLHGLVRDEQGRKMSKSLGNIINPLDMIETYGTDATRLSLLLGSTPGNDMKLSEEKIAGFRNFTNKLWNMSRFMLMNIPDPKKDIEAPRVTTLSDHWILSRLNQVTQETSQDLEKYNISSAGERLRDFTWGDLADWYLEIAKVEGNKAEILNYLLNSILKLWHPFMPYVTETLWQELYGEENILMVEKYPTVFQNHEPELLREIQNIFLLLQNIIIHIRALRTEYKIEPAKKIKANFVAKDFPWIEENKAIFVRLANLEDLEINAPKADGAISFVEGKVEVHLDFSGAVDTQKEKIRIEKEIATVAPYVISLEAKLAGDFATSAPAPIVEKERMKLAEAKEKLHKLEEQLSSL